MSDLDMLRLKNKNDRMKHAIKNALAYVTGVESEAAQILSQKSGVARGKWSFVKGAAQVAKRVKNILERGLSC